MRKVRDTKKGLIDQTVLQYDCLLNELDVEMASALVVDMRARLMFLKRGQMTRIRHSGQAKLDASKQGPAKSNSLQLSLISLSTSAIQPVLNQSVHSMPSFASCFGSSSTSTPKDAKQRSSQSVPLVPPATYIEAGCIFCKAANGTGFQIVHEDETLIAFKDRSAISSHSPTLTQLQP